jgi:hypothetical protein
VNFQNPIVVPILPGPPVEVTYNSGEYLSHKGDFEPPPQLGPGAIHQAVTYKGNLVQLKDGKGSVPIFTDFTTFGARVHFPSYSDVLDHLAQLGTLVAVRPCPVKNPSNVKVMFEWGRSLPFHVPGVILIEDDEREHQDAVMFPEVLGESVVTRVEWDLTPRGELLPWLRLESAVPFRGETTDRIPLGSFVRMRSEGFGAGVRAVSFGDWVQPLGSAQAAWPSRCPACNTPTRAAGLHLVCARCFQGSPS